MRATTYYRHTSYDVFGMDGCEAKVVGSATAYRVGAPSASVSVIANGGGGRRLGMSMSIEEARILGLRLVAEAEVAAVKLRKAEAVLAAKAA